MSFILVVLAVGHDTRSDLLFRPIYHLPLKVVGCVLDGAPHCVASKSPESDQRSAMEEPPTILANEALHFFIDQVSGSAMTYVV